MYKVTIIFLQLTTLTLQMPMQFPLLQPMPGTMQQQQLALQEQMLAVQQFQALQNLNLMPSVNTINTPPILLLVPQETKDDHTKENKLKNRHPIRNDNEDNDSITINAEEDEADEKLSNNMKAYLLVPSARFSLGGIISQIPFLPIEINVPDSISWIYNGISNWISGFGRPQNSEVKSNWKAKPLPILVMPFAPNMIGV